MIATGSYRARGISLDFIESPEKQTPGVKVVLRLEEGPDKGSNIEWIGWLSEKTIQRTGESLSLFGHDGEDASTITRNEVIAVIEHEEYTRKNGEVAHRPRVSWINDPSGAGRFVQMGPAAVAGAKERIKAAMMAAKAKKPAVDPADEPRF